MLRQRAAQVLSPLHLAQGKGEPRDYRKTLGDCSSALPPLGPHLDPAVPGVGGGGRHRPFPSSYCFLHANLHPLLTKKHISSKGSAITGGDQAIVLKKNHWENSIRF